MRHGGNNRQRFVDTPQLVMRLNDVLERFSAPEFQRLKEFLLKSEAPEPEPVILPPPSAPPPLPPLVAAASTAPPGAWHQDRKLLLKEKAALSNPERYAHDYQTLIASYVDALQRGAGAFRRL